MKTKFYYVILRDCKVGIEHKDGYLNYNCIGYLGICPTPLLFQRKQDAVNSARKFVTWPSGKYRICAANLNKP